MRNTCGVYCCVVDSPLPCVCRHLTFYVEWGSHSSGRASGGSKSGHFSPCKTNLRVVMLSLGPPGGWRASGGGAGAGPGRLPREQCGLPDGHQGHRGKDTVVTAAPLPLVWPRCIDYAGAFALCGPTQDMAVTGH